MHENLKLNSSLMELEEDERGLGVLHTAVACGHALCVTVLGQQGFTRYLAQCCVVAAAMHKEDCLLRLLLFTKTVGSGGGLDVLLRLGLALKTNPFTSQSLDEEQQITAEPSVDITLLLPLLAALCVWNNMVDPLVAICVAAWEAGVDISGFICIQDELQLCLSPAAAAPLLAIFAESPLLHKRVSVSPLHIAAAHSAAVAALVLISHGDASLDINAVHSEGCTALMWCMRSKCIPLAKLLLILGADVSIGQEAACQHVSRRNSGNQQNRQPCEMTVLILALIEHHWTRLLTSIGKEIFDKPPTPAPFHPPDEWGQEGSPALTAVAFPFSFSFYFLH